MTTDPYASLFSMIGGGFDFVTGAYQFVKGTQDLKALDAPEYSIPSEIGSNVGIAQQVAYEGLPAAAKAQYNREVQRSQATMLARTGSLQSGISALAVGQIANQDALSNLYVQDAQARLQGQRLLMDANREMAGYKDKEFAFRESRYQQDLAAAQALIGAGISNMSSGLDYSSAGGSQLFSDMQRNSQTTDAESFQGGTYDTRQTGGGNMSNISDEQMQRLATDLYNAGYFPSTYPIHE
jgi:hypothetical protein